MSGQRGQVQTARARKNAPQATTLMESLGHAIFKSSDRRLPRTTDVVSRCNYCHTAFVVRKRNPDFRVQIRSAGLDNQIKPINSYIIGKCQQTTGPVEKEHFGEFGFGLIFCVGFGSLEALRSANSAVLQEGGRHARSACIRSEG